VSLDRSLKSKASLTRHRNVLTRAQRIEKLEEEGRWEEQAGPVFGLPKVKHRKSAAGGKAKKKAEAAAAAEGAAAAAPGAEGAAPAAPAAAEKGKEKEKARK
jgi:small basic protein (TIGR04137 family)